MYLGKTIFTIQIHNVSYIRRMWDKLLCKYFIAGRVSILFNELFIIVLIWALFFFKTTPEWYNYVKCTDIPVWKFLSTKLLLTMSEIFWIFSFLILHVMEICRSAQEEERSLIKFVKTSVWFHLSTLVRQTNQNQRSCQMWGGRGDGEIY